MQNSLNLNISTCIAAPKSCQKTSKQEWFAIRCLEKIRYDKEAMPKTNPFNHGQWTCFEYFFFCFVYMYMAVFRFNRFWIWSVVYIITSLRVHNRIVPGNLSVSVKPFSVYIVLCFLNYCIYDFRTVLRCVDKIPTLIRSQLKQIDCCSFLAPYLKHHTVNHFCKCYFTCHKVDFKIS